MFRNNTGRIATIIALLSTAALPQTGLAASYLDTVQRGTKTAYTSSLVDMTRAENGITTRTLDWRQPSVELYFNLPPSERTSEIILTLSADPLTRVAPNAPLQVQFNNGKPVPVLSNGRGFEARLPLDAGQARTRRNNIRISYPVPPGAECVAPAHGAWSIDLAQSTLRIAGRAKSRHMSLSEVTNYLEQPALSPKKVGLIARGPDGTDMQALAAQGIALRTPGVPKFSVTTKGTDFNLIMVKRNRLFDITDDPMILNSSGARIFVPRGRPTELIFTADTDAEILHMLEIFATRKLPNTRRAISSLGELNLQNRLDSGTLKIDGKTRLLDLAVASTNAASGAQTYKFGVADPVATGGEVLLRLSATDNLAGNSRLRVSLNGKTLGAAKLDKKRKSVAFDIQPGALNATSNILTLDPDMDASSGFSCPIVGIINPGFAIGDGSKLTVTKSSPSPVTELSQLTSTGGLFAQSESYISLPRETRDYQASLRILGRMAKSAGHGLTYADYTRKSDVSTDKHNLIIGPSDMVAPHIAGAPKAFRDAMAGQSNTGDNLLQASYERAASIGTDDAIVKYASAQSAPRKINRGGIATLFSSGNGKLTGVISSAPGSSFIQASQTLIKPSHWNALQGGVARWTPSSVIMAQTAQSDTGITKPVSKAGFKFPELGLSAIDDLDLHWPEINWPEFDMPQVGLPNVKWPSFKSAEATRPVQPISQPVALRREVSVPAVKTNEIENFGTTEKVVKIADVTPRLKPAFNQVEKSTSGLRGPFEFSVEKQKRIDSFQDIRRETKVKWSATKRWFKAKTKDISDMRTLDDVAKATDRLQDRVKPAGRNIKTTLKDKLPGKGLVQLGDRTVSVYGLILIMAFSLVLLLMSLASPASRLGGRH
ncbi:MAG: cellulose biosynthesis cyclic di-GMP-binding regulatory protein BcsB [Litorimonas sp.]